MHKKKSIFILFVSMLLLFSACNSNLNDNSSANELSSIDNNLSNKDSHKYISAKRIYDFQYDVDGYNEDILKINEFPSLVFKVSDSKMYFSIEGRNDFGILDSIYIADFNNDGYIDLGYSQRRGTGSSNNGYRVRIYDYHNDKLIFNDDNQKNSFLDIDEEGNAIIEEITPNGMYLGGLSELDRAGRFIKGDTISFEWYSFDFKLKGMWIESSSGGKIQAYLNQPTYLRLRLCGIGSEKLENAIPLDRIKVKRNDEFYSFEVSNNLIASLFNITFTFLKNGAVELEVTIDQVTTRETINVESN